MFKIILVAIFALLIGGGSIVHADWTPLISSSAFTGASADVNTAIAGVIGIFVAILAGLIIIRVIKNF